MRNIYTFFIMNILASSIYAVELSPEDRSRICRLNIPEAPAQEIELPYNISYFISPNPNGNEVAVILGYQNRLIDLRANDKKGKLKEGSDHAIPGVIDPVFTPDGKYITIPTRDYVKQKIEFFEYNELKANKDEEEEKISELPSQIDAGKGNPYQSVGQPKSNQYNYISDPSGFGKERRKNIQMVVVSDKRGLFGRNISSKKKTLCKNKITGHLPMISKDGKYLSYLDENTHTTKIMYIGKKGDECREVIDLGIPTGKVAFNFDPNNKKIAFHVERNNSQTEWFAQPEETFSTDSFVMSIDTTNEGKEDEKWEVTDITRLTNTTTPQNGTYYPRFTRDGNIIAAKAKYNPKDDSVTSSIQVFENINEYKVSKSITNILYKDHCQEDSDGLVAIGKLWGEVCESLELPDRELDSILIAPFIDRSSCEELVKNYFVETEKLSKSDLLALCPENEGNYTRNKKRVSVDVISKNKKSGAELFESKCKICHLLGYRTSGGISFFDSNGIKHSNHDSSVGMNEEMARRTIESLNSSDAMVKMPPENTALGNEDRKKMSLYILSFINDENLRNEMLELIENPTAPPNE